MTDTTTVKTSHEFPRIPATARLSITLTHCDCGIYTVRTHNHDADQSFEPFRTSNEHAAHAEYDRRLAELRLIQALKHTRIEDAL